MGADGINIIEIKEKQNNEFDLTIDNGNKKLYSDFGVCKYI